MRYLFFFMAGMLATLSIILYQEGKNYSLQVFSMEVSLIAALLMFKK